MQELHSTVEGREWFIRLYQVGEAVVLIRLDRFAHQI